MDAELFFIRKRGRRETSKETALRLTRRTFVAGLSSAMLSGRTGASGENQSATGADTGVEGKFYSSYLLLDDFTAPSGSIAGRKPLVGSPWQTFGQNAALLQAAKSELRQSSRGNGVGYAMSALPVIPDELGCEFVWGHGTQPPVLALFPDSTPDTLDFSDLRLLHIYLGLRGFGPELGDKAYFGDLKANHPFAWRGPEEPYRLIVGNRYTLKATISGKWLLVELADAGGDLVARAQSYDSRLPRVIGPVVFFETFDDEMAYSRVWARHKGPVRLPVLQPAIDSDFSDGPAAMKPSPYGGSATWVERGRLRIDSDGLKGGGAAVALGPLVAGDRVRACVDVTARTGGSWLMGLASASGDGALLSKTTGLNAPGRHVADFVCTAPSKSGAFCIGAIDGSECSLDIQSAFAVKNGPDVFV